MLSTRFHIWCFCLRYFQPFFGYAFIRYWLFRRRLHYFRWFFELPLLPMILAFDIAMPLMRFVTAHYAFAMNMPLYAGHITPRYFAPLSLLYWYYFCRHVIFTIFIFFSGYDTSFHWLLRIDAIIVFIFLHAVLMRYAARHYFSLIILPFWLLIIRVILPRHFRLRLFHYVFAAICCRFWLFRCHCCLRRRLLLIIYCLYAAIFFSQRWAPPFFFDINSLRVWAVYAPPALRFTFRCWFSSLPMLLHTSCRHLIRRYAYVSLLNISPI